MSVRVKPTATGTDREKTPFYQETAELFGFFTVPYFPKGLLHYIANDIIREIRAESGVAIGTDLQV